LPGGFRPLTAGGEREPRPAGRARPERERERYSDLHRPTRLRSKSQQRRG
jgi:hypothetical protein